MRKEGSNRRALVSCPVALFRRERQVLLIFHNLFLFYLYAEIEPSVEGRCKPILHRDSINWPLIYGLWYDHEGLTKCQASLRLIR